MDVHIGDVEATVRPVDDGTMLDAAVLDRITDAVIRRIDARRATDARADDDRALWRSVREGTNR